MALELKKFKCHKEIGALQIATVLIRSSVEAGAVLKFTDGQQTDVDGDYLVRHNPKPRGYYVEYEDGYKSFSPREPFERGYEEILGELTPDVSRETS